MKISGKAVWTALLGVGLLFEVYTLTNKKRGDTLSEVVWQASDATPLVPFIVGIICGHWFWPRTNP